MQYFEGLKALKAYSVMRLYAAVQTPTDHGYLINYIIKTMGSDRNNCSSEGRSHHLGQSSQTFAHRSRRRAPFVIISSLSRVPVPPISLPLSRRRWETTINLS